MRLTLLKAKLHGATVTGSALHYEGSISLDSELCQLAGLLEFERVEVYNCHNGARFATYVILGSQRGEVVLNGAAARLVQPGDKIIVAAYAEFTATEARRHRPVVVLLDANNSAKHTRRVHRSKASKTARSVSTKRLQSRRQTKLARAFP